MTDQEDFLRYYHGELTYLRRMGAIFAERYPKLAGRLELSPHDCADPHIERLLESFAFLTARIQRRLDGEFPEFTSALLGVLYPHLLNSIFWIMPPTSPRCCAFGLRLPERNLPSFPSRTCDFTCTAALL